MKTREFGVQKGKDLQPKDVDQIRGCIGDVNNNLRTVFWCSSVWVVIHGRKCLGFYHRNFQSLKVENLG